MGVGLTTAYSLKIMRLVLPVRGLLSPSVVVGGGWGRPVKGSTIALGAGAALGGAVLCCGRAPVVVSGVDKALPLVFIAAGLGLARAVRGLRHGYFSSMWNLTPALQGGARLALGGRAAGALDRGPAAASGGPGGLAAVLAVLPGASGWLLAGWAAAAASA